MATSRAYIVAIAAFGTVTMLGLMYTLNLGGGGGQDTPVVVDPLGHAPPRDCETAVDKDIEIVRLARTLDEATRKNDELSHLIKTLNLTLSDANRLLVEKAELHHDDNDVAVEEDGHHAADWVKLIHVVNRNTLRVTQVVADNWFEIDPDKPTLVAYIGGVTKHVIRHNTDAALKKRHLADWTALVAAIADGEFPLHGATHILFREDDFIPCITDGVMVHIMETHDLLNNFVNVGYGSGAFIVPVHMLSQFVAHERKCGTTFDDCFSSLSGFFRIQPPLFVHRETKSTQGHSHPCDVRCFVTCRDVGGYKVPLKKLDDEFIELHKMPIVKPEIDLACNGKTFDKRYCVG